jgi:glyoxylase-like metal-dependent hydrolase (beta-lactamase superfamily II)
MAPTRKARSVWSPQSENFPQLRLGDSTITGLFEQPLDGINLLLGADPEQVREIGWLTPRYATETGDVLGHVQAFLVQHQGVTIMVDTCVGNGKSITVVPAWDNLNTPFLDRLRALGTAPETVDYVLCTHLHVDHVGWQTWSDGHTWHPTFLNARHLFCHQEYEYWGSHRHLAPRAPEEADDDIDALGIQFDLTQRRVHEQSIQPVVDAGLVELVDPPHEVVPGVRLIPTPGHTPGHVSVEITSGGQRAVISGDLFHHPCQIARPQWASLPDTDSELSTSSRQALLADLAGTPTRLVGSHFAEPWAGVIVNDGDAYRFEPEPTD